MAARSAASEAPTPAPAPALDGHGGARGCPESGAVMTQAISGAGQLTRHLPPGGAAHLVAFLPLRPCAHAAATAGPLQGPCLHGLHHGRNEGPVRPGAGDRRCSCHWWYERAAASTC